MDLITLDQVEQVWPELLTIHADSIYRAFEKVKDGRKKKGKRYPLAFILTLILLGKLAGETTLEGIIDWVNYRKKEIKLLLNWPKAFPSNNTYTNALSKCDGEEVVKVIAHIILKIRALDQCAGEYSRWLEKNAQSGENLIHTAMDGKVMKGTLKHANDNQPEVWLIALYECQSGIVLAQKTYKGWGYEIEAGLAILHPALVKGRIITTDSLHSYRKWCATVHIYGGYYLAIINDRNPAVLRNLEMFFQDDGIDRSEWQYQKKVQNGHGRLEVREIWASTQMNEFFAKEWAGASQVFMIKRTIKDGSEERVDIVYGITNLTRIQANAEYLLELNQEHWYIENRLHYRRDVTLGEDASQVRVKEAPEVIAALNGGILALMDYLGVNNVAKQMRYYCANPREIIKLLFGSLQVAKQVH
jgi:predicted transposase YbfD/YdcC